MSRSTAYNLFSSSISDVPKAKYTLFDLHGLLAVCWGGKYPETGTRAVPVTVTAWQPAVLLHCHMTRPQSGTTT